MWVRLPSSAPSFAPIAQMDRVQPSEGWGQAFESPRARHKPRFGINTMYLSRFYISINGVKSMMKTINLKLGNNAAESFPDLVTESPRGDREDKKTASGEIIRAFNLA